VYIGKAHYDKVHEYPKDDDRPRVEVEFAIAVPVDTAKVVPVRDCAVKSRPQMK